MRVGGLQGISKPIKVTYQSELVIGYYPVNEPLRDESLIPSKIPGMVKQGSVYAIPNNVKVTSASRLVTGDVLGKGATGTVYSLISTEQYVVKFVSTEVRKTLLNKEIDLLSKATIDQAGHVVSLLGLAKQKSQVDLREEKFQDFHAYALVLERMDAGSLYDLLHSNQPLPWDLRLQITIDVAKGLMELHRLGIIHGDIKSPNVLLNKSAEAKIGDLGAAILAKDADKVDISRIGTPRWMAPEQKQLNDSHISEKSDVYSFGLLLREIITREIPKVVDEKDNPNLSKPEIKGLSEEEEIIFEALWQASLSCQETDPQKRPSLEEIISSLEQAYAQAYQKNYQHEINQLNYTPPAPPDTGKPGVIRRDFLLTQGENIASAPEGTNQSDINPRDSLVTGSPASPYLQAPQDEAKGQASIAKQEEGSSCYGFGRLCGLIGLLAAPICPIRGREEKPMSSSDFIPPPTLAI